MCPGKVHDRWDQSMIILLRFSLLKKTDFYVIDASMRALGFFLAVYIPETTPKSTKISTTSLRVSEKRTKTSAKFMFTTMSTTLLLASEKRTKPSAKFIFTTMSTTLLWASEKRTKPEAKFGTTDAETPIAKTGIVTVTKRTYGFIF